MALIQSAKLYEVQKYISLSGHIWDGHHIFGNMAKWQGLPEDVRKVVTEALTEAAEKERADILRFNDAAISEIKATGVAFNQIDTKSFRDVLRTGGFYAEWKAKFGAEAWSLLEKYAGTL